MTREQFLQDLKAGAEAMGVPITDEAAGLFFVYYSELQRWNRRVNLVSRQNHDWVRSHFLDSLAPISLGLLHVGCRIVDIGAGAGFPGVPLKLAGDAGFLGMAEASGKKCAWLKHLVRVLELTDCEVLEGRFGDLLNNSWAGKFDIAVSRAAAKPHLILETAHAFLVPGGRMLIYTTEPLVLGDVGQVHRYTVPGSKVPSVIWEVKK
jgi:16S rRNA (guanine527-N7)-methyltransferase